MELITNLQDLEDAARRRSRPAGLGGVLVPTMGALHEGHAALIRRGAELARGSTPGCCVSIFVNPTQFNDPADLARYPRTLDADLALCRESGAEAVFAPDVRSMYPPPPAPPVATPPLPPVATTPGLEDAHRPGHFAGVCQVVKRLFDLLQPASAIFGEKDWQQLQVITAMTETLGLPVRIVPVATIREADGLALSSRNRFLSPEERWAAVAISRALTLARHDQSPRAAEATMRDVLGPAGLAVEYATVRDASTLGPVTMGRPARALVAAWAGRTRLIDNGPWGVLPGQSFK